MKNLIGKLALLAMLLTTNLLQAQNQPNANKDPKAEAALNGMSERYKKMTAFKAEFTCNMKSPQEKLDENFSGKITVKGQKFRLKLPEQEIYNNQTTVWTYVEEDKEVTITDNDPDSGDLNPAEIYTMYKKGFKYVLVEEKKENNEVFELVDLTPDDKTVNYFKIRLMINKRTRELKSWQVFEKNGRRFTYTITKFEPNVVVNDADFTFDKAKHPKVEVVDLRDRN
ncbi:MAG: outer membrane lipoprotein carrier protein LolA [Bernardetiaceae bacterium]|jgi:outer membrane lipoprotein-sorting protein|nr:outer membrane lipoprotein carrier protein LolA [Bernardetiaceae bacterium]